MYATSRLWFALRERVQSGLAFLEKKARCAADKQQKRIAEICMLSGDNVLQKTNNRLIAV